MTCACKTNGTALFFSRSYIISRYDFAGLSGAHDVKVLNWGNVADNCLNMGKIFNPDRIPYSNINGIDHRAGNLGTIDGEKVIL